MTKYTNYQGTYSEQFILLISQEIQQDSNLKSIEFGFYSTGTISIMVIYQKHYFLFIILIQFVHNFKKFAEINECGLIQSCQIYLKNNPSITSLTITDLIESKQIILSKGDNYNI